MYIYYPGDGKTLHPIENCALTQALHGRLSTHLMFLLSVFVFVKNYWFSFLACICHFDDGETCNKTRKSL